ncbi:MAG: hypothetical protein AAB917_00355 [Patescibacteria group bacterium]
MKDLIDGLNTRYNICAQTTSEREFYLLLYYYFDYIIKTPELHSVFEQSEHEYHQAHGKLWSKPRLTDEEADIAEAKTIKLEKFNLFSVGAWIHGRIYLPVDDYRNTDDPDYRQDPVAVILLKGYDYTKTLQWRFPEITERLRVLNRWFEGKRDRYEKDLRQFHLMFLDELDKIKVGEKPLVSIEKNYSTPFSFNERTGDFTFLKTKGNISPGSQEYKVFITLYNGNEYMAEYLDILKSISPNIESVTKVNKATLHTIIRNVKEKLGILPETEASNPDIIRNIPKLGYRLVFEHINQRAEQA